LAESNVTFSTKYGQAAKLHSGIVLERFTHIKSIPQLSSFVNRWGGTL
jgi:hypothetical protein